MKVENVAFLKDFFGKKHTICIIPHYNPDGDAMGSTLALYALAKKKNQQVYLIAPNSFPDFLNWLPNNEDVLFFDKEKEKCKELLTASDTVFTLDFNALHRTGKEMGAFLNELTKTFVMIDHHQMPDDYAKIMFSDSSYGSTCELLYNVIVEIGLSHVIDEDIATCLYTGIVTDSGSFKFSKTTSDTHEVASKLITYGVDNPKIHERLFNNNKISRLKLLSKALENLTIFTDEKVAFTYLTQEDLDSNNFQKGDTEGIVNYGLSIQEVELAAIFIENKNDELIKISFRSQGGFDVNQFARKYFSGGGHINAAGGKSIESLEQTLEKFKQIIKQSHP